MATLVDCAGPLGIPAAVIHPDDPMPKTWRIAGRWTHEGIEGAYVTYASGFPRRADEGLWGQIVYSIDAKRYDAAHVGARICQAVDALRCASAISHSDRLAYRLRGRELSRDLAERRAYYQGLGLNIVRLDWYVDRLIDAQGKPSPDKPLTGKPTPKWADLSAPSPADDDVLAACPPHLCVGVPLHPEQEWPADGEWRHVAHDGKDWAFCEPDRWIPLKFMSSVKQYEPQRGLKLALGNYRRRIADAVWNLKHGSSTASPAPVAPDPPQRPVGPPPPPGDDRVRWLGEQVTALMPHTVAGWAPLQKRRQAARRALALSAGYEPESPINDAGTLPGSLSLHLLGLNEFARRELGEVTDHAVL
jgi:hypothetical protein